MCATLAATEACSRQVNGVPSNLGATNSALPFGAAPNPAHLPATSELPALLIPAGTPLVISLQSSLSSTKAHPGDIFQAVLEEAITNSTRVVLARGTLVNGSVLAAKSADAAEPGYLRLGLASILVNHRTVELHTSSVFAKRRSLLNETLQAPPPARLQTVNDAGEVSKLKQPDVEFSTTHRLTFRLLKSLSLPQ